MNEQRYIVSQIVFDPKIKEYVRKDEKRIWTRSADGGPWHFES